MLKLSTFKVHGETAFGEYREGKIFPVSKKFREKWPTLRSIIEECVQDDLVNELKNNTKEYFIEDVQILPPISPGSRVFCVGLNYHKKYLLEAPRTERTEIILFSKDINCFVGSNCPIIIPNGKAGKSLDYEGELGIIIGKSGKNIRDEDVDKHIFGFTIVNDGSIRDWQKHSIFAGKNFEYSSSCGPCILINQDELDPEKFLLTTKLNDRIVQKTRIEKMIFNYKEIIAYISSILTLMPGDIIATGSPEGSGTSQNPHRFLENDDLLEIEISNIGILRNKILSQKPINF